MARLRCTNAAARSEMVRAGQANLSVRRIVDAAYPSQFLREAHLFAVAWRRSAARSEFQPKGPDESCMRARSRTASVGEVRQVYLFHAAWSTKERRRESDPGIHAVHGLDLDDAQLSAAGRRRH